MATQPADILILNEQAGLPSQLENAGAFTDKRDADALARSVAESHRKGRLRKKQRDLLAEMYMMHLDGEGDAQWVTIVNGERLRVAPNLDGGLRCTTNLLRPIVNNFVAYQTAIPYRVIAESKADRLARDKARIDSLWANSLMRQQRFNELFAEALYMAVVYGFCPLHAYVREDLATEVYENTWVRQLGGLRPVFIDCWAGDPFTMVFNTGATRRSVATASYERVMPLALVQENFKDVPWIGELEGRTDLPSASRFQMTARRWLTEAVHGTPVISSNGNDGDETVALICRETAPGMDPDFPDGRLTIVALSGVADTDKSAYGNPMLLYDSAQDMGAGLPGRRFSFVRLYSDQRYDDVYGYPWITPLDELQIRRNNYETLLANGGHRASHPQLAVGPSGGGDDDTLGFDPDGIVEAVDGKFMPQYIEYPTAWMNAIEKRLEATEAQMFRIGGWQAASRGESTSGQPYSAIVTLQQADDTVHGPMNRALQGTLVEYLQLCHALTKEYQGPFPIPVQAAGDEFGYLARSYVYADELSDEPPQFVVVSGFGSTKEAVAQQLINLSQVRDANGEPLLTAKQVRKQYPDQSIWPAETDIAEVRQRRAQAINYLIRDLCREYEEQIDTSQLPPQWEQMAAQQILAQLDTLEPIERDDDLQLNIDTLSELVQDTTESRLVRAVARLRRDMNYEWQAQMAAQQQMQMPAEQPAQANAGPAAPQQEPSDRIRPLAPVEQPL